MLVLGIMSGTSADGVDAALVRVRGSGETLAWRLLRHQPQSGLVQWYRARTADGRRDTRKVMIVALARKLLVAFWELVTTGKVPEGMKLHPAPVAG